MDFREEFEAYKREHPYREFPVQGGHLTFVSSQELYIGAIRGFLNRLQLRKDDDNRWTYDDK